MGEDASSARPPGGSPGENGRQQPAGNQNKKIQNHFQLRQ